MNRYFTKRT